MTFSLFQKPSISGHIRFGRDASLVFGEDGADTAGMAYYSCMQYSTNSTRRKPMLAVLDFNGTVAAPAHGGHTDICTGGLEESPKVLV